MANIYDRYDKLATKAGILRNTKKSIDWFRTTLTSKNIKFNKATDDLKYMTRYKKGTMVTYQYDPKLKEKLPYYDTYPLVILMDRTNDGWYGLNVHYLSPTQRARILAAIITANKRSKGSALVQQLANVPELRPCLKRYLSAHLMSKPVVIPEVDWEIAINLPFEGFQKESAKRVWRISNRRMK